MMPTRYMATTGMFDGVHRGHIFALRQLESEAERRGLKPAVFTFSAHPLSLIAPEKAPRLLSTPSERAALIRAVLPAADVVVLDLAPELLALTAREFLDMLHRDYGVDAFAMGFNNHIGSDRATAADLADAPIPVLPLAEAPADTQLCSTAARNAIAHGSIDEANRILGRRWCFRGRVVHGKQLGRKLGFPTANIEPVDSSVIVPPAGVYAVDVTLPSGAVERGMANIGVRPTVDAEGAPVSFEVHILNFYGNLYGEIIEVEFLCLLRREKHFRSLDELAAQLALDAQLAKNV